MKKKCDCCSGFALAPHGRGFVVTYFCDIRGVRDAQRFLFSARGGRVLARFGEPDFDPFRVIPEADLRNPRKPRPTGATRGFKRD
jgi:hypothetical protein